LQRFFTGKISEILEAVETARTAGGLEAARVWIEWLRHHRISPHCSTLSTEKHKNNSIKLRMYVLVGMRTRIEYENRQNGIYSAALEIRYGELEDSDLSGAMGGVRQSGFE
jgi:hypothetical protein